MMAFAHPQGIRPVMPGRKPYPSGRRGVSGLGLTIQGGSWVNMSTSTPGIPIVAMLSDDNAKLLDWISNPNAGGPPPVVPIQYSTGGEDAEAAARKCTSGTSTPDEMAAYGRCLDAANSLARPTSGQATVGADGQSIVVVGMGQTPAPAKSGSGSPSSINPPTMSSVIQAAFENKPAQSVPPSPQAGEVPAVGSGASIQVSPVVTAGSNAIPVDTCTMSLLPSLGVCDTYLYIGAGVLAVGLYFFLGKGGK